MREHGVEVAVTKDSGGDMAAAKLDAARRFSCLLCSARQPPLAGVPVVDTPASALH